MPPNEMGFDAEDRAIREVLFGDEEFRIPRYQRHYAWTEDQISEFWNDVTGSNKNLFIGSFIFNYETVNDNGYVEVVDGQQRLLSFTIFSAVLGVHQSRLKTILLGEFRDRISRLKIDKVNIKIELNVEIRPKIF